MLMRGANLGGSCSKLCSRKLNISQSLVSNRISQPRESLKPSSFNMPRSRGEYLLQMLKVASGQAWSAPAIHLLLLPCRRSRCTSPGTQAIIP